MQEPAPEVEVLLPERLVEPERLREVAVELLRGRRVGLDPAISPSIGSPGMSRGIAQSIVTAKKNVSR